MLDFDEPASLDLLARHINEIALVMVEPVQSRRPDLQPFAFLRELRRMTREAGALLLFDELITGFRMAPGGAQAFFGVQADLVTYGKIVAGGLPMGVVAGTREAMSVFDGGLWRYGDDSYPAAQRTLFAGAYFKHPISMGVAVAVLEEVRAGGQVMYDRLNGRTTTLVERINAFFEAGRYPMTAAHFASSFRIFFGREVRFPDLFNHHLVHEGVYVIPETGTYFLSTAHTDADLEAVYRAIRASAEAMRRGGFIPDPSGGGAEFSDAGPAPILRAPLPAYADAPPSASVTTADADADATDVVREVPLTEGQRQLWVESQMGDDAGRAYIENCTLRVRGPLDVDALHRALQALVDRHDALRITFGVDGDVQRVHPPRPVPLPRTDLRDLPADPREAALAAWAEEVVRQPFDLVVGSVVRFALAIAGDDDHLLVVAVHHAALDGWSFAIVMGELDALYTAERDGRPAGLAPRPDYGALVRRQVAAVRDDDAAQAFWAEQFAGGVPVLELPTDRPRPSSRSYRGQRATRALPPGLLRALADVGRRHGLTVFNLLLSAYSAWLGRISGQDDLVVGVPSAGQAGRAGATELVGFGINVLPVRTRPEGALSFVEHARRVRRTMLHALEHQDFSFPRLVDRLLRTRDPSRPPIFSVTMNLDRAPDGDASLGGVPAEVGSVFAGGAKFDLLLNLVETADSFRADCEFSTDLAGRVRADAAGRGGAGGARPGPARVGDGPHRPGGAGAGRLRMEPDGASVSARLHPRPVRGSSGADAGRRGRRRRRRRADVPRAGRGRQPAGTPAARPGGRSRGPRGPVPGARSGVHAGVLRHPQGRRGVRSPGSRPPRRAPGVHAGGQ
jgi:hypothetical protein